MNIIEIEEHLETLANAPFDQASFPFRFIEIYDAPKATIQKLKKGASNKAKADSDILWQRKLFYRLAMPGVVPQELDALVDDPLTKKYKPRILFVTDGENVSVKDTKKGSTLHIPFNELNAYYEVFLPLANSELYEGPEENPADIKAAGQLAKLYDAIIKENPDWKTKQREHDLNMLMTRLLFCMYAEDTGIFDKDIFTRLITNYTGDTGGDVHLYLHMLFEALNTPDPKPITTKVPFKDYPYVNGGLFEQKIDIPRFNRQARRYLVDAAKLNWADINPDIFGSMIQAVVDDKKRGDLGMHYTSVTNIMKVIDPLFLMSLEEQFEDSKSETKKLQSLLKRMSKIRVFDPACGSGNFLIIAYRELRKLEMKTYECMDALAGGTMTWRDESVISLSNFYGIEYDDFAAETAKLSMWIAEYQMNQRFKQTFGHAPAPLPLKAGGNIVTGNALRVDWEAVCPPPTKKKHKEKIFDLATVVKVQETETVLDEEVETYIIGNPPYLGSTNQDADQKEDLANLFKPVTKSYKNLDFVAAWYLKGARYCQHIRSGVAFVATNSICQGEQVAMLWPLIFDLGVELSFAHQSFKWRNLASDKAGVTCVIVGIRKKNEAKKLIFSGKQYREVKNISPYLLDFDDTIVFKTKQPLHSLKKMVWGNKPTDGGNLILSKHEKDSLITDYPQSEKYIRRFFGSQEFIKGIERWCLWIADDERSHADSIPFIKKRILSVAEMRAKSTAPQTREYSQYGHKFRQIQGFGSECILIPKTSSERRKYLPVGFFPADVIISDSAFAVYEADPITFAILSSRLHIVWVSTVCGQLETRIRYSNTMGYNTLPLPTLSDFQKNELQKHAWELIAVRERHPGRSIASLYDPNEMPSELLTTHQALDDTLEKVYLGRPFENDTERLEHLFKLYAKMTKAKH